MLTFLPPLVALVLLGLSGVSFFILLPLAGLWFYQNIRGRTWRARADHHAGADGRWLAGGNQTWPEVWSSWMGQRGAFLLILFSLGFILWRGASSLSIQGVDENHSVELGGRALESIGMREIVEALDSQKGGRKLDEKLRLSDAEGLQMKNGGEGSNRWSLQNWSRRKPFGEMN